ncbi:acyltransferase family-domain-containing protein [Nemania sp. NC0429]|nr:acyltransferase family-domain-containing protein [Nemania sp. NC0429]
MFSEEEQGMLRGSSNSRTMVSEFYDKPISGKGKRAFKLVSGAWCTLTQVLIPSFCQGPSSYPAAGWQPRQGTSSLDGLRGYAAVAVMNYHILYAFQPAVFYGYGLPGTAALECARPEDRNEHNLWLHQLPIIRLLYTGTWPISIFFVLSGFALSYKPLRESRKLEAGGDVNTTTAIVSSLVRRPFRLYGPPLMISFITMMSIQLGAYEPGRAISSNRSIVSVIEEIHHKRFHTLGLQILDWLHQTWRMLNVFWWGDLHNKYDVHLWTIPTEFRCSLTLFLVLPAYLATRPIMRKAFLAVLIVYVYALDRWDVALFYAGMLIADTAIPAWQSQDGAEPAKRSRYYLIRISRAFLLGLSLLFLSAPDFCIQDTPGFEIISRLIPSSDPAPFRFIPNLGGILLVALLAHTDASNRLVSLGFNSPFPQYLGRISYSLYLVHGPLMHTVGYALFPLFWRITGVEETWRYVVGFAAAYFVFITITIWTADLVCRTIDEPCVKLAKIIQERISL